MLKHSQFLLILIWTATFLNANGQSKYIIQLTTKNGLPSNKVYCAYQDVNGIMWFGTDNGLVRYNGSEFKTFSVKDGLPDNDIFSVFEDKDLRLWIIGFKQAPCYFYKNKLYTSINDTFLESNFKDPNMFKFSINQSEKRILFFSNIKENFSMLEYPHIKAIPINIPNSMIHGNPFRLFHSKNIDYLLSGNQVLNLSSNTSFTSLNRIYFKAVDQIEVNGQTIGIGLSQDQNKLVFFHVNADSIEVVKEVVKDNLIGFYCNQWGEVLVIAENGDLYKLNKNNLSLQPLANVNTNARISTGFIDKSGNSWICTHDNGLYILPEHSADIIDIKNERGATCIAFNPEEKSLSFGFESNTIFQINKDNRMNKIEYPKELGATRITALVYLNHKLYLGRDQNMSVYDLNRKTYLENVKKSSNTFGAIKDMEVTSTGDILIASAMGASILHNEQEVEEIYHSRCVAIQEAANGDVYLGTINGLLIRKSGSQKIDTVITKTNLDKARITDIKTDNAGRVWIGTAQYGLFVLQGSKVNNISDDKEASCFLTSYYVKNIFIDKNNNAWVSTDKGLNKISIAMSNGDCNVERITSSFSIPDENINATWVIGDTIYMASLSGIFRMYYAEAQFNEKPGILLLNTSVNLRLKNEADLMKLNPEENNISINFLAIAFRNPESVEFRYRLRDSDDQWIRSKNGHLELLSLPSGKYHFEVQAVNLLSNEMSEIISLDFVIEKPWYKKVGFIILWCSLLVLLIWQIVAYRTRMVRNKVEQSRKVTKQVAELEMQALRAQMNPHFIFNALSAIQNYFVTNNEEKANSYMSKFSRLIRQMLEYSKNNFIALDEEISLVKNYMELERMRFEDKLEFGLSVENNIDATQYKLPSLLLQPILENAVNHGIRPSKSMGKITLTISLDNDSLYCIISDNGIGIIRSNEDRLLNNTNHNSAGIDILSKRIESLNQLYNCNISFSIEDISKLDSAKTGTRVVLKFPISLVSESILKLK